MWINAPVYAMEINLDHDTCEESELIIGKLEYNNINECGKGCPYHYVFYNAIHQTRYFDLVTNDEEGYDEIIPVKGQEEYIYNQYWSLKRVVRKKYLLTEITDKNAYEKIFSTIEELAKC